MRRIIKKVFVPHKENNYHPHFWRAPSVISIALLIVMVFVAEGFGMWALPRIDITAAILPSVLTDLANSDRRDNGLSQLRLNPTLVTAASMKANDMAKKGYFSHVSPEGVRPWHWFSEAGYNFIYAGENLAIDFSDSEDVNRAWMLSPTHRANILNEHFTEIGIAMASGVYNGRPTTFVVQLFGQPVPGEGARVVTSNNESRAQASQVKIVQNQNQPTTRTVVPETIETIAETPTFVAVKNNEALQAASAPAVAGEEVYSSWFAKMLLSPRKTLAYIYFGLGLLIVIALFLLVGIEVGKHHPKHVIYGILLLGLIVALFYVSRQIIFTEVLVI